MILSKQMPYRIFLIFVCLNSAPKIYAHGLHKHSNKEHRHFSPKDSSKEAVLEDKNIIQDRGHLKEELPDYITEEDVDKMSPEEIEYHHFRTHDLDKNDRLDGLEVLNLLAHSIHNTEIPLESIPVAIRENERQKRIEDFHKYVKELEFHVDRTMEILDINNDGYITYYEFIRLSQSEA